MKHRCKRACSSVCMKGGSLAIYIAGTFFQFLGTQALVSNWKSTLTCILNNSVWGWVSSLRKRFWTWPVLSLQACSSLTLWGGTLPFVGEVWLTSPQTPHMGLSEIRLGERCREPYKKAPTRHGRQLSQLCPKLDMASAVSKTSSLSWKLLLKLSNLNHTLWHTCVYLTAFILSK